jgi:hypothetical protein
MRESQRGMNCDTLVSEELEVKRPLLSSEWKCPDQLCSYLSRDSVEDRLLLRGMMGSKYDEREWQRLKMLRAILNQHVSHGVQQGNKR